MTLTKYVSGVFDARSFTYVCLGRNEAEVLGKATLAAGEYLPGWSAQTDLVSISFVDDDVVRVAAAQLPAARPAGTCGVSSDV